ncbi:MAG: glucose-6-phosphate dehydrogenase, partial [Gammaproteobacteria bacterium]
MIVIFGATGDLTRRKLMPALCHLARKGALQDVAAILGVDREPIDAEVFRTRMQSAVLEAKGIQSFDADAWRQFAQKLEYFACDLKDSGSYTGLAARIQALNGGVLGNRLYYCATPPTLVASIIDGICQAGLSGETSGWARIIIEKPFGRSL